MKVTMTTHVWKPLLHAALNLQVGRSSARRGRWHAASGYADSADVVVQLIDKSDKLVATSKMDADHSVAFYYVKPGTYYARAFIDRNGNGLWDTGEYDADQQPEAVYYFSREIETKAKFDITLTWNLVEKPLNQQKPSALVKKKSSKKQQRRNRNADRAAKMGIEYIKKS